MGRFLKLELSIFLNFLLALSQDENEMGRFLREQGSQDKSKAGKMMIAVGKAQSYSAQQRWVNFILTHWAVYLFVSCQITNYMTLYILARAGMVQ